LVLGSTVSCATFSVSQGLSSDYEVGTTKPNYPRANSLTIVNFFYVKLSSSSIYVTLQE
jgi:hypothetical protein